MLHRHWPALDGVRGIAILTVFGVHTHPRLLAGGHIGVDLFFVLSGFLITSILLSEQAARSTISLARFYLRRALRLLPALTAMVAAVCLYAALFTPDLLRQTLLDAQAVLLYYFNWWILPAEGLRPWPHQRFFRHLWSLSIEEQFYLLWPVLLLAALAWARSQRVLLALIAAGIAGPAVARAWLWEGGSALHLYIRTDLRFDLLMWGALGAWLISSGRIPPPGSRGRRTLERGAVAALLAYLAMTLAPVLKSGFLYLGGYSLVGFVAAWLIVAAATALPAWLSRLLEGRFLRWTGKISYGLYIWHIPVFWTVFLLELPDAVETLLAVLLTYAIAALSYRYWEARFLRLKERYAAAPDGRGAGAS